LILEEAARGSILLHLPYSCAAPCGSKMLAPRPVSELAVRVPLLLFVLDTVCVEFRISTDTAHGNSRGSSLHKRYGGQ
jgi:hypothetical protein